MRGLAGMRTDSPMADVFASFSGPWKGRSGLRVEGSAYLVKYTDADDFDQSELQGGAFYEWRPRNWRLQLGVQATRFRACPLAGVSKAPLGAAVVRAARGADSGACG
jgi:hypothetical protein